MNRFSILDFGFSIEKSVGKTVAVLTNPSTAAQASLGEFDAAARAGPDADNFKSQRLSGLENAFLSIVRAGFGALIIVPVAFFASRSRFVEFTARNHLPAIYVRADYVDAGGLMSYGTDFRYQFRRAAYFVDKILKGSKPADLPVAKSHKVRAGDQSQNRQADRSHNSAECSGKSPSAVSTRKES